MKKSSLITVIIVCVAIVLACVAGYLYMQNRKTMDEEQQQLQAELEAQQERAAELEKKIEELATQLREDAVPAPAPEKLREAFAPDNATGELPQALKAESARDRMRNFFAYLDSKGYARRRGLEGSSREICERVLQKLDDTRPLVNGENQNLFALMRNITFFYRVLGKGTLLAINDIIEGEAAIMEPVMALFFEWLNPWQPQAHGPKVSREMMYDYAGFFLQSMGGRSYLFRREPGIRMLTLYYSLLVLDQANRDGLNVEGIDIGPPVELLIREIRYSRRLSDRQKYLDTLKEIQGRY
jgi:cell division protein FtsB